MVRQTCPHQQDVGFVTSRVNPLTGAHCVLYDGKKAGLDNITGRWSLLCSHHGTIITQSNKRIATALLREPSGWCESCQHMAEMEEAEYMLTLRATRTANEQLKRLANLALGDPEKCQLFERLTGKQPEHYLNEG